jgi:hypothetical protein
MEKCIWKQREKILLNVKEIIEVSKEAKKTDKNSARYDFSNDDTLIQNFKSEIIFLSFEFFQIYSYLSVSL